MAPTGASRNWRKGRAHPKPYVQEKCASCACVRARADDVFGALRCEAGLGETAIRDLNDEINKLFREKSHWERRIVELNGPDYSVSYRPFVAFRRLLLCLFVLTDLCASLRCRNKPEYWTKMAAKRSYSRDTSMCDRDFTW